MVWPWRSASSLYSERYWAAEAYPPLLSTAASICTRTTVSGQHGDRKAVSAFSMVRRRLLWLERLLTA